MEYVNQNPTVMNREKLREAYDKSVPAVVTSEMACFMFSAISEEAATYVAQHIDERKSIVRYLNENGRDVFHNMGRYWQLLAESFVPGSTSNTSVDESRVALACAVGKFQRNLIGGIWDFTKQCVDHEPSIRSLIFNLTTFTRVEEKRFHPLHRILAQLICNIISPQDDISNESLATTKWKMYLSGRREDDVVIRLLDSPDIRTTIVTLTIFRNLLVDSEERTRMVLDNVPGVRWLARILGNVEIWLECLGEDDRFERAVDVFGIFIQHSLQSRLFDSLGDSSEAITPSQTTFLKIVDATIHQNKSQPRTSFTTPPPNPNRFLVPVFHRVAGYILNSMRAGGDDPRLPKIMQGTILVLQILASMGLSVQEKIDQGVDKSKLGGDGELTDEMKSKEGGVGIIKPMIDLLQHIVKFFPRQRPQSNVPTQFEETNPLGLTAAQHTAVSGIKTDLVQLLGILTFEDKDACDWVRECGGVQTVLGMTEVDEASPYLREHALFLVRNLMLKNPENQAIIKEMNPLGVLNDITGELLPLPEKMQTRPE